MGRIASDKRLGKMDAVSADGAREPDVGGDQELDPARPAEPEKGSRQRLAVANLVVAQDHGATRRERCDHGLGLGHARRVGHQDHRWHARMPTGP